MTPAKRLPEVARRWLDGERGLSEMCDYGAKRQREDPSIVLEFNIWITERDFVTRYMAEMHPTSRYYCTWLVFKEPA